MVCTRTLFLTFLSTITIVVGSTQTSTLESSSIIASSMPAIATPQATLLNTNWEAQSSQPAGAQPSSWTDIQPVSATEEQVTLEVENQEFHQWILAATAGEVPVVKGEDAAQGTTDTTQATQYVDTYKTVEAVSQADIEFDESSTAIVAATTGTEKVGTTGIVIKLSTTNKVSVEVLPPLVAEQIQVRGKIIFGKPGDKPTVSLVILKGLYLPSAATTAQPEDFPAGQQVHTEYKFNYKTADPTDSDIMFSFSYDEVEDAAQSGTSAASNFGIMSYIKSKLFGAEVAPVVTASADESAVVSSSHFSTEATSCKSIEGCIVRCVSRSSAAEDWSTRVVYTGTSNRGAKTITKCVTTSNGFLTVMKWRAQIGSNQPVVITFQLSESSRLLMNTQFAKQYLKGEIVELLYGINPDNILIVSVTDPGVVTFSISPSSIAGDTRTNTWAEFFESLMLSNTVDEGKYLFEVTNVLQACGDGEFIDASNVCGTALAATDSSSDSFLIPGGVVLIAVFGTIICILFILFVVWIKRREAQKQAAESPNAV